MENMNRKFYEKYIFELDGREFEGKHNLEFYKKLYTAIDDHIIKGKYPLSFSDEESEQEKQEKMKKIIQFIEDDLLIWILFKHVEKVPIHFLSFLHDLQTLHSGIYLLFTSPDPLKNHQGFIFSVP